MTAPGRYPAGYVDSELADRIVRRTAELGRDTTHANAQIAVAVLIDLGWKPPSGEVDEVTAPDHTCTPPDPGEAAKVSFYTCSTCGATWLLLRCDDRPDEWRHTGRGR